MSPSFSRSMASRSSTDACPPTTTIPERAKRFAHAGVDRRLRRSPPGQSAGAAADNSLSEREAQQLRDRLRELAGGQVHTPGPTMVAVRDRVLARWYAAGGARCMHPVR